MSTRAALYIRVSTDEQAREGYSLVTQREFLEKYASQQGWEVFYPEAGQIYQDDGFSAGSLRRPALERLLRDAKSRKFDVVLIYKVDRFSRKLKDLLTLIEELESWGVAFKSATEWFDTTTSNGKLMLQQLGSFAEFERARIAERIFPGMVKSVEQGNWHGARYSPYGYRYDKTKELLEVVPQEAEVVRRIYTMYLGGQSSGKVAGYLYQKGYKTRSGGRFHTKLVLDILKSQLYIGKIVWNKHHYDKHQKTVKGYKYVKNPPEQHIIAQGKHEPLIAEEEFQQVQKRLIANRKGVVQRANNKEYALSGILYCAKCAHKYQGTLCKSNGRTKAKKRWYRCMALHQHNIHCSNPAIRAEVIEPPVFKILELLLSHPSIKKGRMDSLAQSRTQVHDEHLAQQRSELKTRLKITLDKQSKLTDTYLKGTIAEEVFKDHCAPLREEEAQLKQDLAKLEMQLIERERSVDYQRLLQKVVADYDEVVQQLDITKKKELLQLIFKRVLVNEGGMAGF